MVTNAKGRFINRPTKTSRGVYDKFFIYVPTELARDSSFPLRPREEVNIQIDLKARIVLVTPLDQMRTTNKRITGKDASKRSVENR